MIGMSVGGWIGWTIGSWLSFFFAFILGIVGTGVGLYVTRRFINDMLP